MLIEQTSAKSKPMLECLGQPKKKLDISTLYYHFFFFFPAALTIVMLADSRFFMLALFGVLAIQFPGFFYIPRFLFFKKNVTLIR